MNGRDLSQRVPVDEAAEQAVLGAVLVAPNLLATATGDEGLRPEHFYDEGRRKLFEVCIALDDDGDPIDEITVAAEAAVRFRDFEDPRVWMGTVQNLQGMAPSIANIRSYAKRVVECAELRRYRTYGFELTQAAGGEDWQTIRSIEKELITGGPAPAHSYTPAELGAAVWDMFESGSVEVFPTPWPKFNKLLNGGFRRGALTVVSGITNHGKSIVLDQILDHAARSGDFKAHLYTTEMNPEDRALRNVARISGIAYNNLLRGKLSLEEGRKVTAALKDLRFGITDVSDWTAAEIARDIRRRNWDIVGVDLFQGLGGGRLTSDLDEKSRILNGVTKVSQGDCHLLLCAHVKRGDGKTTVRRAPSGADLRDTGSLENDADNVMFVHRRQDEGTGRKLLEARIYLTKVRSNGRDGGIDVVLDEEHMEFQPPVKGKSQNAINDELDKF